MLFNVLHIPSHEEKDTILNYNIEFLRVLAVFGIIWFHSPHQLNGKVIAYSGLIIFILISVYYLKKEKGRIHQLIKKKANRLIKPWAFWFLIYGILNLFSSKSFLPESTISAVLAGTKIHLWFLPFLFIVSVTFIIVQRTRINSIFADHFILIISIITLIAAPIWRVDIERPWAQWFHAVPAVFIGITISNQNHFHKFMYCAYSVCIILISLLLIYMNLSGVGVPYLIGFILFNLGLKIKKNIRINSLLKMSKATFGIYLIHPIIFSINYKIGIQDYVAAILTFVLSYLIIRSIQKLPFKITNKFI